MSTITETDLQRLEDLINKRFNSLESEQKEINTKLTELRIDIATLKESQNNLNTRIDETNKRLDSIDTRLNTVTLGVFGIVGVLVTGLLTIAGKVVFFPNL